VNNGKKIDGVYHIYDFTFEAFCLIGVEPCYQGAALELFSSNEFKTKLSEMMQELKETFSMVTPSAEAHDTHPQNILTEGGEKVLHEKTELAARYGIDVNALDFSLDDFTLEELADALNATAEKRRSVSLITTWRETIAAIESDNSMLRQWEAYARRFSYVGLLSLGETCQTITEIMADNNRLVAEQALFSELQHGRVSGESEEWIPTPDVRAQISNRPSGES
jgi:hypothetical protein